MQWAVGFACSCCYCNTGIGLHSGWQSAWFWVFHPVPRPPELRVVASVGPLADCRHDGEQDSIARTPVVAIRYNLVLYCLSCMPLKCFTVAKRLWTIKHVHPVCRIHSADRHRVSSAIAKRRPSFNSLLLPHMIIIIQQPHSLTAQARLTSCRQHPSPAAWTADMCSATPPTKQKVKKKKKTANQNNCNLTFTVAVFPFSLAVSAVQTLQRLPFELTVIFVLSVSLRVLGCDNAAPTYSCPGGSTDGNSNCF